MKVDNQKEKSVLKQKEKSLLKQKEKATLKQKEKATVKQGITDGQNNNTISFEIVSFSQEVIPDLDQFLLGGQDI